MGKGKIVMGGRSSLEVLSDAFDSDNDGEDIVMVVRFDSREDFVKANSGEPVTLTWDFG
jgi:hypothetical protein